MTLDHYKLLGRSGLRVSPMSLGTMTFGSAWGWGADGDEARRIFDVYVDRGGNFIDTAVNYTDGGAEQLLGSFIGDKRERIVLATKFTMARDPGNPNSGGNHRLNMMRSVEQSLMQLRTDRIDLLYLHAWDMTTRPDEVVRALDDLVRSGRSSISASATRLRGALHRCRRWLTSEAGHRPWRCRSSTALWSGP